MIKLRNLGDVLLTTPLFSILKNRIPGVTIDAYIYRECAPILENREEIRQLLLWDANHRKKGLFFWLKEELRLLRQIRREKYDLILNLTEGDRGTLVSRISGAQYKVGYDAGSKRKRGVYTHLTKICGQNRHTVEKNLDTLRRIGIFPTKQEKKLSFPIEQQAKNRITELLNFRERFILIHPTSRWRFKCWPPAKVRQFVLETLKNGWGKIVITSGKSPEELAMVEQIVAGIDDANLYNLAGKTTIQELGALVDKADRILCMDSVVFHLSSALQKRVTGLFGPTSPITWGPWQNPLAQVVHSDLPCMPCFADGCGGSKVSDCLEHLDVATVMEKVYADEYQLY